MMCLLVVVLLATASSVCYGIDDWDQFRIVWQDEFDVLDMSKWQHEVTCSGGGNGEFQLYSPEPTNSYVANGLLYIKPTLLADTRNPQTNQPYGAAFMQNGVLDVANLYGSCNDNGNDGCFRTGAANNIPPVMSGRLRSFQRFSYRFGRAVVRAKMPVGDWIWPAIWMLPEDWVYGGWPRSGEIDIIEAVSNRDLKQGNTNAGIQKMGSTLHWGRNWDENRWYLNSVPKFEEVNNYGDNFHTFIFDWSTNGLRFYVDDETAPILDVPYPLIDANPGWQGFWEWGKPWNVDENPWAGASNLAPFDQAFHFVLNVAVGGTNGFIPDNAVNRGGDPALQKPWGNGDGYLNSIRKFYAARGNWKWTWDEEGENNAMQVDFIRVYQRI